MAEKIVLEATRREITGKHVRHLRAQGVIPGVLYGPAFESINLQIPWTELRPVLIQASGTKVIDLSVGGESYHALVRNVHRAPVRGDVLHVDFYRVQMDVVMRTEVPVILDGDIEAFEKKGGVIIHEMNSVLVECLPGDLPSEIRVSIASLNQIGDRLYASDLPVLPGVIYHVDAGDVVASTTYLESAEPEEAEGASAEPELIRRREEENEED